MKLWAKGDPEPSDEAPRSRWISRRPPRRRPRPPAPRSPAPTPPMRRHSASLGHQHLTRLAPRRGVRLERWDGRDGRWQRAVRSAWPETPSFLKMERSWFQDGVGGEHPGARRSGPRAGRRRGRPRPQGTTPGEIARQDRPPGLLSHQVVGPPPRATGRRWSCGAARRPAAPSARRSPPPGRCSRQRRAAVVELVGHGRHLGEVLGVGDQRREGADGPRRGRPR